MAKARTRIPAATAAAVLFAADRMCCVCTEQKPVQIHHVDEDPTNHDPTNLAVLCLDCHEKTLVSGGFSRSLDAAQVRLYRDHWNQTVAARRSTSPEGPPNRDSVRYDVQLVTTIVEINRIAENWVNLAFLYDGIENKALRDEAVDKALSQGVPDDIEIMLRRLQGRIDDVPEDKIQAELKRLEDPDHYRLLATLQEDLGHYRKAAETYLRGLTRDLDKIGDFTVAHHLKELAETEIIQGLFVQALQHAADEDDLWWQVRALQELGWTSELHALVLENEDRIASDPDLEDSMRAALRKIAATAKGDSEAYREAFAEEERLEADVDWGS